MEQEQNNGWISVEDQFKPVIIKCPSCDYVQAAIVEATIPFATYIHNCVHCGYTIMESEWDEVKPFELNPPQQ